MTRLLLALLAALLLALDFTGWRGAQVGAQLREAQRASAALSADLASRDRTIARLNREAQANSKREAALRQQQSQASRLALNREAQAAIGPSPASIARRRRTARETDENQA